MEVYAIQNLRSNIVEPKEPWSCWQDFEVPEFDDPKKLKRWATDEGTKYLCFSTYEGVDATQRISNSNKATRMVGVVADWDMTFTEDEFKSFMKRAIDKEYTMQWVSRSASGGIHALWFFEQPILCHSVEGTKRFLKRLAKEIGCDALGPKWDEKAFMDSSKYYTMGRDWAKVSDKTIPISHLHTWQYDCQVAKDFTKEGINIPLDKVKEEIDKKFPGAWTGPFVEKSRGKRFWDPTASNGTSAVVFPQGMRCFTGTEPFVSWAQLLGSEFVNQYEVGRIGKAIEKYWYDGDKYFVRLETGEHMMCKKEEAVLDLRARHGLSAKRDESPLTEVEKALFMIHNEKRVSAAVPFAMFNERIVTYDNQKFFNTATVKCIEPASQPLQEFGDDDNLYRARKWGEDFPILADWMETIFGEDQLQYELAWLHYAYVNALEGNPQKGHAHFLVGEPNCGKTLYNTTVLAGLFGGHIKASDFLTGKNDSFNDHLFSKYLWTVDDEAPSASKAMHTSFTAKIKEHVANSEFLMNGKYKQPGRALWHGRLSITLNDDPISLRILPDLDMSVKDKVMIFRMNSFSKFTRDFKSKVEKELKYFASYLKDFVIPDDLVDVRFGVRAYIEESISDMVTADSQWSPIIELLKMFRDIYFDMNSKDYEQPYQGTTSDLMMRLAGIGKAQVLLKDVNPNRLGWGLRYLVKQGCSWVERSEKKGTNEWLIKK